MGESPLIADASGTDVDGIRESERRNRGRRLASSILVWEAGTVLDYVRPEAQAVVDDLNELDNEEYEL